MRAPAWQRPIALVALSLLAAAPLALRPRAAPAPAFDPWQGHTSGTARPPRALYAEPLAALLARHLNAWRRAPRALDLPAPRTDVALAALHDAVEERPAHLLVLFVESYGATALDDPQHRTAIEPQWRALERRLGDAGVAVRSRRLLSPTFGGGSWRAHASFLSGLRIDNQRLYELLLHSGHRSLTHHLRAAGYRTVAFEPGIRGAWTDAARLGFEAVYDAERIDYRGPTIGWWKIPDQFTLLRLHQAELAAAAAPVFAKVSLITSHFPYTPIPDYVPDWQRLRDGRAYERALPSVAADDYRDLAELSGRYVVAMRYELAIAVGFVLELVPRNALVLVAGDHQPPKLATHDNSSWAVPLHVLSRRHELVERFAPYHFETGLLPANTTPPLPMDQVPALLVDALR